MLLPLPPNLYGVARSGAAAGFSTALPPNIDPFAAESAEVGAAGGGGVASAVLVVVERISSWSSVLAFALGGDVFVDEVDGAEDDDDDDDDDGTAWVEVGLVVVRESTSMAASQLGVVGGNGSIAFVVGECW